MQYTIIRLIICKYCSKVNTIRRDTQNYGDTISFIIDACSCSKGKTVAGGEKGWIHFYCELAPLGYLQI